MSHDVHERVAATRRRITRKTLRVATCATTLIVAAVLIANAHGQHQRPAADAASHSYATGTPLSGPVAVTGPGQAAPAAAATADAFVAPSRRVVLPTGSSHVDGFPVGFPHTPEGAAALAVALGKYVATLDYATADEATHLYMDPALAGDAATAAATLVRGERTRLGLPITGPVASGYGISSDSFGVQWRQVAVDVYDVTVIGWTTTAGKDGRQRQVVAGLTRVKWIAGPGPGTGGWKAVHATGAAAPAGLGEIGSKAFNDNGYAVIEQAQS